MRRPQYEPAGPVPLDTERDAADLAYEVAGLRQALAIRNMIGRAQGILIERHGTGSDRAFAMLVQMSQQSHLKLHDVARLFGGRDRFGKARRQVTLPARSRCILLSVCEHDERRPVAAREPAEEATTAPR